MKRLKLLIRAAHIFNTQLRRANLPSELSIGGLYILQVCISVEVEGLVVIGSGGLEDQTLRFCTDERSEIGFQSWVFSGEECGSGCESGGAKRVR